MSIHGYPADKSIFYCNLKLGLVKLQEETVGSSHADIDQDDVSLAGSGVEAVVYSKQAILARVQIGF